MKVDAEVGVVGVGTMGSMACWRLSSAGLRVLGIEQFQIPHSLGSGHGESRVFRMAYYEGEHYVPLLARSLELWRELERESGEALLFLNGGLMIGPRSSRPIAGAIASARRHGLPLDVLEAEDLRRRYPAHRIGPDDIGTLDPVAGYVLPEHSITAAAHRARDLGAEILESTKVLEIRPDPDGVTIESERATFRTQCVVLSVGAWLPEVLAGQFPLRVTRQVMAWFPVDRPGDFVPQRFPIFIRETTRNWYGFPTLDGRTIKVALHELGAETQAEGIDRRIDEADTTAVADLVKTQLTGVRPVADSAVVCMYSNTPDTAFLIGRLATSDRLIVLGGFSGHGFKFAPVVGELAADMVRDSALRFPVRAFDPRRFADAYGRRAIER